MAASVFGLAAVPSSPAEATDQWADAPFVEVALAPREIVADPLRSVFYASIADDPSSGGVHAGRVVTINALTGAVVGSHALGVRPDQLSITPDGSALYVGANGDGTVRKYALPAMTLEWTYDPGTTGIGAIQLVAVDIVAMPGTNETVVVAYNVEDYTGVEGIAVVDDGVARPVVLDDVQMSTDTFTFGNDPSELWGSTDQLSAGYLYRYTIDASGISVAEVVEEPVYGEIISFEQRLYASNAVFDLAGSDVTPIATFDRPPYAPTAATVDSQTRTYFMAYFSSEPEPQWLIDEISIDTLAVRREWIVPGPQPFHLTTIGNGRIAYRAGQSIMIVDLSAPDDLGSYGEYTALSPHRILDTRIGQGRAGNVDPIGPGQTIDVQITGSGEVPASDVAAVVINVTVTQPTQVGYLTIYPSGIALPTISSLNFVAGQTVPNLVTVPVGRNGRVSIYNPYGSTHVLFDVAGYYAAEAGNSGARFHAMTPYRLLDTRERKYPERRFGPLGPNESTTVDLRQVGLCCDTAAVVLNVTVTNTTSPSFLTVYPPDVSLPEVSNLNYVAGTTRANQVIVRAPASGLVAFYNLAGSVDVVVDIVGYFNHDRRVGDRGRFFPYEPFRAVDTRVDSPFPPPGELWSGDILYIGDSAETMAAYALNVTVTGTQGNGYVTAYPYYPGDFHPPNASTLNYLVGQSTVPNHAIVKTGPYLGFYNFGGRIHLIVDVFGGFA